MPFPVSTDIRKFPFTNCTRLTSVCPTTVKSSVKYLTTTSNASIYVLYICSQWRVYRCPDSAAAPRTHGASTSEEGIKKNQHCKTIMRHGSKSRSWPLACTNIKELALSITTPLHATVCSSNVFTGERWMLACLKISCQILANPCYVSGAPFGRFSGKFSYLWL